MQHRSLNFWRISTILRHVRTSSASARTSRRPAPTNSLPGTVPRLAEDAKIKRRLQNRVRAKKSSPDRKVRLRKTELISHAFILLYCASHSQAHNWLCLYGVGEGREKWDALLVHSKFSIMHKRSTIAKRHQIRNSKYRWGQRLIAGNDSSVVSLVKFLCSVHVLLYFVLCITFYMYFIHEYMCISAPHEMI